MKTKVDIIKFKDGISQKVEDMVVEEKPVTLFLNNEEIVTLLCTPQYLEDLAIGFLTAEGLLNFIEGCKATADYNKGIVWVEADKVSNIGKMNMGKRVLTTGCGKGTSFYHFQSKAKPIESSLQVPLQLLFDGMKKLHSCSELYLETGGVHGAALMETSGDIMIFREDVGRHNAVDKIFGYCLNNDVSLSDKIFLTSGRVSSEIVGKIVKMGIPVLVSRSAPTSLAVKLSQEMQLSLLGFVRSSKANIYSCGQRIV